MLRKEGKVVCVRFYVIAVSTHTVTHNYAQCSHTTTERWFVVERRRKLMTISWGRREKGVCGKEKSEEAGIVHSAEIVSK